MKYVYGLIILVVFVIVMLPIVFFAPIPALLFIFGLVLFSVVLAVVSFIAECKLNK